MRTERTQHAAAMKLARAEVVAMPPPGQMKMIGSEIRQSDSYPSRVAPLRSLLLIKLGIQHPDPATEATPGLTKEETSNVCYKCFMLGGRTAPQCYMRTAGGDLTDGHKGTKAGREVDCELFDAAYPLEHAERVAKIEAARKAKTSAVRKFTRGKKGGGSNKR